MFCKSGCGCSSRCGSGCSCFLNANPDPASKLCNKLPYEELAVDETNKKDCSKVRNLTASPNLLEKNWIKLKWPPIACHFFSFFYIKLLPVPVSPGSGSRSENSCGSGSIALTNGIYSGRKWLIDCGALQIQEDSKRPVGGEGGGLKDWHNWTHIEAEAQRVGPGEQVPALVNRR